MIESRAIISVKETTLIEIIYYTGDGTKENPSRVVKELWDKNSNLIAIIDPSELSQ